MKVLWLVLTVPALIGAIWVINLAAGTRWAVLVAAVGVFAVFAGDLLGEHRAGRTSLQRFEEREQRRHAA